MNNERHQKRDCGFFSVLLPVVVFILSNSSLISPQPPQYTEGKADQTLKGSGRVNSSTLAMEFSLPLGNYPGRGISVPISMSYSSKLWQIEYGSTQPGGLNGFCFSTNPARFGENTTSGWTTSVGVPFIEDTGSTTVYDIEGNVYRDDVDLACNPRGGGTSFLPRYVRRVLLHLPSGETHELRVSDSIQGTANSDGVFYAVDGSNIRYIQDSVNGIYKVQMPDGSYYDLDSSTHYATAYTDRNGNSTTFTLPGSGHANGYWTDTLGRHLDLPVNPSVSPTPGTQTYSVPGIDGAITYTLHWKLLKDSTAEGSALTNFSDGLRYYTDKYPTSGTTWDTRPTGTFLFASFFDGHVTPAFGLFNPVLLTEIELPTGQSYKFSYNVYGEIDKIVYPTGGEETFTYSVVASVSYLDLPYSNANRGVVDRKVYKYSGDTSPYEWTYSASTGVTRTTNPDGTKYERYMHLSEEGTLYGFDSVLAGMPFRELTFSSDGKLVAQKLTHWVKTTLGSDGAQWHPQVDYEESIVYDSSGNGVSAVTKHEYRGDLGQKETPVLENKSTTYAFMTKTDGGSYSPGTTPVTVPTIPSVTPTTPVRISELTYLIDDSNYSGVKSYYTGQNINGLVTISKIKDGSGTVVSQAETVYDESERSPGYRGNPTTAKVWDSTKGVSTNPSNYISTSARFDTYGNQYEATDALGNTTITTFDSTYHAFPIQVTSPVPDSTNTHGSNSAFVTSATFDVDTGFPLTTTDANGLTTAIEYDPDTLRPRYTRFYSGSTQIGPTNETIYHDESGSYWVKNKAQIDDTHYAESITYFDGLGRAWKTEEVNSGGNIFTEKEFDSDGRVSRVCNPYRSGETKQWTTNVYDTASRVIEVDLPDSSKILTDYGVSISGTVGVTKQITDQAGKKRKGYSDAMGNMIRVIEDPTGQNLSTDYVFDTLGNLRKTTQGSQNRYFMHDSLGRLLYAKQVEQETNSNFSATDPVTGNTGWSAKYLYDDNGNITSTTDANNNSVTAYYDHLNRIYNRDYSEAATPDVGFFYDGKGLSSVPAYSNGRTTKVTSSASETKYMSFDIFGHLLTHRQTTDGTDYDTAYSYNIAGALIEETYPSGRVVKNTLDDNGELEQVQSRKSPSYGYWQYAGSFSRDTSGNVTKMQLGNGRWETASYNSRGQVMQIGLGTTDADTGLLKLEYAYNTTGNTDDNGAMLEQKITVPAVGSNPSFMATQTYAYDALNRLTSATESVSSAQTWKQEFSYDRYGNRSFVTGTGHTTTLGSCSTAECNPSISSSTNRISQSGYTYDANGSLTQNYQGERFVYDAENHQTEYFDASNSGATPDATYAYDGQGKRVKKISSTETTIFVYDGGGQVVAEYSTALASTQQVSYLTQDHLGSPRVTTNENGVVTNRKDFMAFGDEAISAQRVSGLSGNGYDLPELRTDYTGYEKDLESGLEFAQARYYNPTHGRFTSVDPMIASATIKNPQTFNRYSYVLNSPYKFTDPLGLLSEYTTGACGNRCQNSDTGLSAGGAFDSAASGGFVTCPEPCPTTTSPPLPEGWTMNGGVLTKTTGANELGSVTVTATEGAIQTGEQVATKSSFWGKIWGGVKFAGKWGGRGLRFLGSRMGHGITFVAMELAWPRQHVGDPGVDDAPMLDQDTLKNFQQGTVRPDKLDKDEVFYRIYGTETSPHASWLSPTAYTSEARAREKLALRKDWKNGNNASFIIAAVAPAGTLVYRGIAASQGRGYPGGGRQVFIPNTSGLFYGSPRRLGP